MRTIEEEELMVVCKQCGKKLLITKRDLGYMPMTYNRHNVTINIIPEDITNPEIGYYFTCICCNNRNYIRKNDHQEISFFGIKMQTSEPALE